MRPTPGRHLFERVILARGVEVIVATPASRERQEGTMTRRVPHAYLDGSDTLREIFEADPRRLREIASELDPERQDPLLNPWRGSGRAAIRAALGH
jgi:hypothetical protein